MAIAIGIEHVNVELKLTGGPWGTFDQAEACLAPVTTVRMLASRAAPDRLATRRVESMMAMMWNIGMTTKEKPGANMGAGQGGGNRGNKRKVGDAAVDCFESRGAK